MDNVQMITQKKQRFSAFTLVHVLVWVLVLIALYFLADGCGGWASGCRSGSYGKLISYYHPIAAYIVMISVLVFSTAFAISRKRNSENQSVVIKKWGRGHTISALLLSGVIVFAPSLSMLLFIVFAMVTNIPDLFFWIVG